MITLVTASTARAGAVSGARTPVILDTDMWTGPDDVGAEANLFALDLRAEDQVIAIEVNTRTSRAEVATDSWKCAAAIAQFYGYPNVPVGSDMPDNGPDPTTDNYIGPCASYASPNTPAPIPAVESYREALVGQPDGSVVIVCTGYEENLANLLTSPPDSISPLSGAALVAEKVKTLVIMGGGYPSLDGENNFEGNAGAARYVQANWPTPITYDGHEVGAVVFTGETVSSVHPADSPVRAALLAVAGAGKAIASYDVTAAYYAIRPTDTSLTPVGPGTNAISTVGANAFTLGAGDDYYLLLNNATALEASIEALWDTLPGTTPQTISFTSTPPSTPIVGGSYAASAAGGASGNPVTLTIDSSSTSGCTIDSSGNVTFAAPLGTCIIDANEPGDTTYAPATAEQTIDVAGIPQTISFTSTPPTAPAIGSTYDLSASGGASGNAVTFSIDKSSTSGCTVSGSQVTFSAPTGSCVVDANELGTTTYAPAAQAQQTIEVIGVAQTVSFTSKPGSERVGDARYTPAATASSGLSVTIALDASSKGCTLSHGAVSFVAVGTCVIDATQAGTAIYMPTTTQQRIAIGKGLSKITITSTAPRSAKTGRGSYTPSARSTSGDKVQLSLGANSKGCQLSHGVVTFHASGTCVLVFSDPGNANYRAATPLRQVFTISKASSTSSQSRRLRSGSPFAGAVRLVLRFS